MSYARPISKISNYFKKTAKEEAYSNNGLPGTVTSIGSTLDYIITSLFPNAKPAVATEGDLPGAGNSLNDYRIVSDYNSTGQAAGYRWTQLEGQPAPEWNLDQLWDSNDSILQQWALDSSSLFVNENGMPGGQTIHGSTLPNEDLILSANSGDGTLDPNLQTGFIKLFGNTTPTDDNIFNLGKSTERFASIYLAGELNDGTDTATVAQMAIAYVHSQITSGNPHSVTYAEVLSKLGSLTVDGDISTQVIDLSTGGNKTLTVTVTDDSHNHTVSTITDFNDATWTLLKARLVDTGDVTWTFDDGGKTASALVVIDTASIDDIDSPAVNKILAASADGLSWEARDGRVSIVGDIDGSAVYNSATDEIEIDSTVVNTPLDSVDRIDLENLAYTAVGGNPIIVTLSNHGMQSGRKVCFFSVLGENKGEKVITYIDANTFSVPITSNISAAGYVIPNGSQLLFDSLTNSYCVKLENAQLSHHEISNLTNSDDHTQYLKTTGRTNGSNNKAIGGELANGNLYLSSTSHATKGDIRCEDTISPENLPTYGGGVWTGTDIGSITRRWRDLYLNGVIRNLRIEEVASLPTAIAQDIGRIVRLPSGSLHWNKTGVAYSQLWEMPSLVGRKGKALVVSDDETQIEFTEIDMIASDSLAGELTNIGTTVQTISAPANAIGIYVQWDEANGASGRMAFGTSDPTITTGLELLQGEREYFRINSDFKVIAESGVNGKLSYTWSIK